MSETVEDLLQLRGIKNRLVHILSYRCHKAKSERGGGGDTLRNRGREVVVCVCVSLPVEMPS